VLPGEDDSLDEVKATVESLVHSKHLTAGQAFSLYEQLDSKDPVEQVSAREIIAALQSELAEPESERADTFEELFPVAKKEDKIEQESAKDSQIVNLQSTTLAKLPPLAPSSGEPKKKGSKPAQVDPRLDVMCSLMSVDGLKRFLETQCIVPEETMARHEDLHCLALASAVPPASSSSRREEKVSR
jgi:hypothetical protein